MATITLSQLILDCQVMVDDTSIPNTTSWVTYLNESRKQLFRDSLCFLYEVSASSLPNVISPIAEPADLYLIRDIRYCDSSGNWNEVTPLSKKEWEFLSFVTPSTSLQNYYEELRVLSFWPLLSAGAYTDTIVNALNATSGSTDPTLQLTTGTSNLPQVGRCLIDNEVIGWMGLNSDGVTLMGVKRGLEGTTPATHSIGATFTNRDIRITYYQMPQDLVLGNGSNSPTIETVFDMYKMALKYYACYQAKIHDTDDLQASGVNAQMQMFVQLYEKEKMKFVEWINSRGDETWTIRRVV